MHHEIRIRFLNIAVQWKVRDCLGYMSGIIELVSLAPGLEATRGS